MFITVTLLWEQIVSFQAIFLAIINHKLTQIDAKRLWDISLKDYDIKGLLENIYTYKYTYIYVF